MDRHHRVNCHCFFGIIALWTNATEQFPDPALMLAIAKRRGDDENRIAWTYVLALRRSARRAQPIIIRKGRIFRALLVMTAITLILLLSTSVALQEGDGGAPLTSDSQRAAEDG